MLTLVNTPGGSNKKTLHHIHISYRPLDSDKKKYMYSGPCDLRLPIQPAKYGLKLKVVLKQRDVSTKDIRVVSLISSLKIQGIVK